MVNSDRSDQRTSGSWLTRLLGRLRSDGNRSKTVRSGDRFGKVAELFEGTQTTWQVWQTVDFVDMPHAKLIQVEPPHRIVTMSLATLLDKRFYRRLASAPGERLPDPPALPPEATGGMDERREGQSLHGEPETVVSPDQTGDVTSDDDIIRFLEPESRADAPKTNPFSKARIGKRRTDKTASGVTH